MILWFRVPALGGDRPLALQSAGTLECFVVCADRMAYFGDALRAQLVGNSWRGRPLAFLMSNFSAWAPGVIVAFVRMALTSAFSVLDAVMRMEYIAWSLATILHLPLLVACARFYPGQYQIDADMAYLALGDYSCRIAR